MTDEFKTLWNGIAVLAVGCLMTAAGFMLAREIDEIGVALIIAGALITTAGIVLVGRHAIEALMDAYTAKLDYDHKKRVWKFEIEHGVDVDGDGWQGEPPEVKGKSVVDDEPPIDPGLVFAVYKWCHDNPTNFGQGPGVLHFKRKPYDDAMAVLCKLELVVERTQGEMGRLNGTYKDGVAKLKRWAALEYVKKYGMEMFSAPS